MAMDMKSMVQALAGMPEGQRRTMMTERLTMFAELGEEERRGGMRQMMEAVGTLQEADIKKMLKTRTQILLDFPEDTRMTLMKTHMALLQSIPQERVMMEMKLTESIVPELSAKHQQMMKMMMADMQKMMPAMAGTAANSARPTATAGIYRPRESTIPERRTNLTWLWWLIGIAIVILAVIVIAAAAR